MRVVVALLIGGCTYQSPGTQTAADAAPGEATADAEDQTPGPPPTACVQKWLDHQLTFFNTGALAGTNLGGPADERDASLSKDRLQLYFVEDNTTSLDLMTATRANTNLTFEAPVFNASLSRTDSTEGKLSLAGDGLTGVIASDRATGHGGMDLWLATRPNAGVTPFSSVTQDHLGQINTASDERDPFLSDDGLDLYFSTGSPQVIERSHRATTTADFGPPAIVIDSGSADADPTLSADQRVIVFASNRDGSLGAGDMWYATRAEKFLPFGPAVALDALNTTLSDGDPHITADGCLLYFASNSATDYDIYVTEVNP